MVKDRCGRVNITSITYKVAVSSAVKNYALKGAYCHDKNQESLLRIQLQCRTLTHQCIQGGPPL